jgi:hypothetical protein
MIHTVLIIVRHMNTGRTIQLQTRNQQFLMSSALYNIIVILALHTQVYTPILLVFLAWKRISMFYWLTLGNSYSHRRCFSLEYSAGIVYMLDVFLCPDSVHTQNTHVLVMLNGPVKSSSFFCTGWMTLLLEMDITFCDLILDNSNGK